MLKIVKRTVPLETEGTINRLSAELAEARGETDFVPFPAAYSYQVGEYIVHSGKVYIVTSPIIRGETVYLGRNVNETSMEEVINALQKEV